MELVESKEGGEAQYWQQKVQERVEQRDEFFKPFPELLPPSRLKDLQREEQLSPKKVSLLRNKAALEGHQALKFMLPKQGRNKIIKDGQPKDQGPNASRMALPNASADNSLADSQGDMSGVGGAGNASAGRRSAMIGSGASGANGAQDAEMAQRLERIPMLPHYAQFKRMSDEQKEEHYQRMGQPSIKRKRLHFKSIERFAACVLMYFKPGQVLLQENENYGGLRQALQKFQDLICAKLEEDPILGPNG